MKAKELMIGDWLSYVDTFGEKVVGNVTDLTKNVGYEIVAVDNCHYDSRTNDDFSIIEPIPLTPEILEANGFEIMRTIHGDELCRTYKIAGRNLNYCFMYGDDKDVAKVTDPLLTGEIYFYVMYVHELQHALRLCGLNEMADNFKLTKKGDNDNE